MTLLELLIALAIVAGLFALVWPVMTRELDEWNFRSSGERVEAILLLARSEAMRSRIPLEVVYIEDDSRKEIIVRRFDPWPGAAVGGNAHHEPLGSWAHVVLSRDLDLVTLLAESIVNGDAGREAGDLLDLTAEELDSLNGDANRGLDSTDSDRSGRGQPLRLAIYLGDGTAVVSDEPRWLLDADGRRASLRINPWTGAPILERQSRATPPEPEEIDNEVDSFMEAAASQRRGGEQ